MKNFSLLPRQDHFYTALSTLSTHAHTGAELLQKYVHSQNDPARQKILREFAECRAQSKSVMNNLTDALARSFVTPFDREDIQSFSNNLYRIPKLIEKVIQRMELHGLVGAEADFARQVNLIVDEATAMDEVVSDLIQARDSKKITEKVRLLHDLEQKGDDILQELLASLFAETREVKDLLLRKDIYDMLEKVVDSYRNAAAVALQIVLKYS